MRARATVPYWLWKVCSHGVSGLAATGVKDAGEVDDRGSPEFTLECYATHGCSSFLTRAWP